MGLFTVNQSSATYFADLALYGLTVPALATFLLIASPVSEWSDVLFCTLIGLGSWTVIEYSFHRFILHGLQPFQYFHELHHKNPHALICTPTIVSGTLIAALVFLPALLSTNLWLASALTLGVVIGYLAYSVVHHATHHESPRILRRLQPLRRWSHEQEIKSFFPRSPGTRSTHGAGSSWRIPVPVGCH